MHPAATQGAATVAAEMTLRQFLPIGMVLLEGHHPIRKVHSPAELSVKTKGCEVPEPFPLAVLLTLGALRGGKECRY